VSDIIVKQLQPSTQQTVSCSLTLYMIFDKFSTITSNIATNTTSVSATMSAQDQEQPLSLALQAVSEETLYKVSSLFNVFKQMRVEGIDTTEAMIDNNSDISILNRAFDIHLQTVRILTNNYFVIVRTWIQSTPHS
jgi:hypothetical protein